VYSVYVGLALALIGVALGLLAGHRKTWAAYIAGIILASALSSIFTTSMLFSWGFLYPQFFWSWFIKSFINSFIIFSVLSTALLLALTPTFIKIGLYVEGWWAHAEYPVVVEIPRESETSKATTTPLKIIGVEASSLYLGEWGRIIIRAGGAGSVSVKLEGDVEWINPGRIELSGVSAIEVPVKPKIGGEVPVRVVVESASEEDSKTVWLKVAEKRAEEEREDFCPVCRAPAEPGAKYCWRCGAKLAER